jgi:tetratricopeptide (TPR) repeat protein
MNFDQWRAYWRGRLLQQLKRPQQAIQAYQEALRANPSFAQAARSLGYLYASQQQAGDAEDCLLLALRLRPDANTWFNLGFLRQKDGRREGAAKAFQEAVRLNPRHDRAWYGLGLTQAQLGRHAEAVSAFERAAQLEPRNPHIWYALGMAQHHCHEPDKVAAVAKRLAQFDPHMARHLIQETERGDLRYLIRELET